MTKLRDINIDKGEVLGQARENSTNAVSVYSPPASTYTKITGITLCNQSGAAATFRLFLDNDGTTYDQTTALFYDVSLAINETLQIDVKWFMSYSAGNLAYRSSVANAITITVFGVELI